MGMEYLCWLFDDTCCTVRIRLIPYSLKIWRELNLVDWPQPVSTKIFADINLVDDYRIKVNLDTPMCLVLTHASALVLNY